MQQIVSYLLERRGLAEDKTPNVIPWSCPVPSFGNVERAELATVGINPSNKEFVDDGNNELSDDQRRFHTLRSLGLKSWSDAEPCHHLKISVACKSYFESNPYDRWFRVLDNIISGTGFSYYSYQNPACHLDLVPFATSSKWANLDSVHKNLLLSAGGEALGLLVRDSPIKVLVLNGRSVVSEFGRLCADELHAVRKPAWTLPRVDGEGVAGYAYVGVIKDLAGISLGRDVTVLGYNHNLQSSFGVTSKVKLSIGRWIAKAVREVA